MGSRKSQRDRLLAAFLRARDLELSLPEILDLGIAQYSARLHELRSLGFRITNTRERVDGMTHSRFKLIAGPGVTPPAVSPRALTKPEPVRDRSDEPVQKRTLFDLGKCDRSYLE
jgi:Helix-turn-helix domain